MTGCYDVLLLLKDITKLTKFNSYFRLLRIINPKSRVPAKLERPSAIAFKQVSLNQTVVNLHTDSNHTKH